jgi:hypothetical protein
MSPNYQIQIETSIAKNENAAAWYDYQNSIKEDKTAQKKSEAKKSQAGSSK